jgi:5S rRNA maturation endonuclease (ribonuclease M5)
VTIAELKATVSLSDTAAKLGIANFPSGTGKMCSPIRAGDENPSFNIYEGKDGLRWKDFGTGDGGDQVTLIEKVRGVSQGEAIKILREFAGDTSETRSTRPKAAPGAKPKNTRGIPVKIYSYLNADGSLAHQTLRYEPKSFLQRRPANEGDRFEDKVAKKENNQWWLWKLKGIEPVLYNLPQLIARSDEVVWFCEGEKDADRAIEMGWLATTAPMGAGNWRDSYTAALAGREVYVFQDSDAQGESHAELVARALIGKRCRVRVLDWSKIWPEGRPDKADLSLYVDKYGNGETMVELGRKVRDAYMETSDDAVDRYRFNVAEVVKTADERDGRTRVELPGNGKLLSETANALGLALKDKMYQRDGIPVYVTAAGRLETMPSEKFHTWLELYVVPYKRTQNGEENASLSDKAAQGVLESWQFTRHLRPIRGYSEVPLPVFRKDGALDLLGTGYDEESQVLVQESQDFARDMTFEDAQAYLLEVLSEFPFGEEATEHARAKAVALGSMFAAFLDLLLPVREPRPAFIFSANSEGAGKTLLCRYAVCPVFGPMQITAPPDSKGQDELSKLLSACAIAGDRYLVFDNWRGEIKSSPLEAFITASTWKGRLLGLSKSFVVDKNTLIFITSNSARVNPDMRRRTLHLALHVKEAFIEDRKFKKDVSEEDILRARGTILAAMWSVAKHWDDSGRPRGSQTNSSFPRWSSEIGGIIEMVTGVHPCQRAVVSQDDTLADMVKLVGTQLFGGNEMSYRPATLMADAREKGLFHWVLDEDIPEREDAIRKERSSFGKILARFNGRQFGDRIVAIKGEGHTREIVITRVYADHSVDQVSDHVQSDPAPSQDVS